MKLLLVGTHFNKPSSTVLKATPQGARVELRREPKNPYDENAIGVYMETSQVDQQALWNLEQELEACGWTLGMLDKESELKLGHVGASGGKPLQKAARQTGEDFEGTLELLRRFAGREMPTATLEIRSDGLFVIEVDGDDRS